MVQFGKRNTMEGYSIIRPPLFDDISFDFWKVRMMKFLQSIDYQMWHMVQVRYNPPLHTVDRKTVEKPFMAWTLEDDLHATCS